MYRKSIIRLLVLIVSFFSLGAFALSPKSPKSRNLQRCSTALKATFLSAEERRFVHQVPEIRVGLWNVRRLDKVPEAAARTLRGQWHLGFILEFGKDGDQLQRFLDYHYPSEGFRAYEGSSYDPNIVQGFFLDSSLPVQVEVNSFINEMWTDPKTDEEMPLFSRDLLSTSLFIEGRKRPIVIFLSFHNKSQNCRRGDPLSTRLRTAQLEFILNTGQRLRFQYRDEVPIILAGDFNQDLLSLLEFPKHREIKEVPAQKDLERNARVFERLHQDFTDVFDIKDIAQEKRVTHYFFPMVGNKELKIASQLDGLFVSKGAEGIVDFARVVPVLGANGKTLGTPKSFNDREVRFPSDHFPLEMTIDTARLISLTKRN